MKNHLKLGTQMLFWDGDTQLELVTIKEELPNSYILTNRVSIEKEPTKKGIYKRAGWKRTQHAGWVKLYTDDLVPLYKAYLFKRKFKVELQNLIDKVNALKVKDLVESSDNQDYLIKVQHYIQKLCK